MPPNIYNTQLNFSLPVATFFDHIPSTLIKYTKEKRFEYDWHLTFDTSYVVDARAWDIRFQYELSRNTITDRFQRQSTPSAQPRVRHESSPTLIQCLKTPFNPENRSETNGTRQPTANLKHLQFSKGDDRVEGVVACIRFLFAMEAPPPPDGVLNTKECSSPERPLLAFTRHAAHYAKLSRPFFVPAKESERERASELSPFCGEWVHDVFADTTNVATRRHRPQRMWWEAGWLKWRTHLFDARAPE